MDPGGGGWVTKGLIGKGGVKHDDKAGKIGLLGDGSGVLSFLALSSFSCDFNNRSTLKDNLLPLVLVFFSATGFLSRMSFLRTLKSMISFSNCMFHEWN